MRVGHELQPCHRRRKAIELLALLCLHAGGVDRAFAARRLWPDSTRGAAKASLRQALSRLRALLGPAAARLASTRYTITLDLAGATVDLLGFDACLDERDEYGLVRALDLYRGDLLEGWSSEWILEHRRRRHEAYIEAKQRLAALLVQRGSPELAEQHLDEALRLDPDNEGAARALMELHAAQGRTSAAGSVYRALRRNLAELVDAAPSRATEALFDSIRAGAFSESRQIDARATVLEGTLTAGDLRFPVQLAIQLTGLRLPRTRLRLEAESVPATAPTGKGPQNES